MKQGGLNPSVQGFTIIETLIVLTITAALGVSAFALISGRQQQTEFNVATNTLKQQMQQIFNETASGFFPSLNTLQCTPHAGFQAPTLSSGVAGSNQGTNSGCIFLGKVMQFADADQVDHYNTYTIVGNQFDNTNNPVSTLAQAFPEAIGQGAPPGNNSNLDVTGLVPSTLLLNGLQTVYVTYVPTKTPGATPLQITSFGYISKLASIDNVGNINSGTQTFQLYGITGSGNIQNPPPAALASPQLVNQLNDSTNYDPASQVNICVTDGARSGLVQIGSAAEGSQQAVTLAIKDSADCSG